MVIETKYVDEFKTQGYTIVPQLFSKDDVSTKKISINSDTNPPQGGGFQMSTFPSSPTNEARGLLYESAPQLIQTKKFEDMFNFRIELSHAQTNR